jgi:hypothetical protein
VCDLSGGVDARIGPAGDGQARRGVQSGDDGQDRLDDPLDGTAAGLDRPAEEVGPVV